MFDGDGAVAVREAAHMLVSFFDSRLEMMVANRMAEEMRPSDMG